MEKYIIIILCLIIIYLLCFNNNIEKAGNTSSDKLNSDLVDSIKNLGQLAQDIQKPTGLTLPGNLVVTNNVDFKGSLNFLPKGCIIAWSGELNAIPYGWTLCDGSNGTPDLRERFLMGSTTDIKNNTFGGNHTYNFQVAGLNGYEDTACFARSQGCFWYNPKMPDKNVYLKTDLTNNNIKIIPKYYAIAWIIKTI